MATQQPVNKPLTPGAGQAKPALPNETPPAAEKKDEKDKVKNGPAERKDRFKRMAGNRTKKILHQLDVLGNCSNKTNYDYDAAQVTKIFAAIDKGLDKARGKFVEKIADTTIKFDLD